MTSASRVSAVLATALVATVLIILVGPIVLLAVFSFNDSSIIALPWEGFTLEWYRAAFSDPDVLDSLRNSTVLAGLIAPLCVALGTATAWGITRFQFRTRAFWSGLVGAPLVIPWLVMGVSGLLLFASLDIDLSLVTVGVMHIAVTFPLVTALVSARLIRFERNQEEAAVDLGASQRQLMTKVVLPQLAPTLVAALDEALSGLVEWDRRIVVTDGVFSMEGDVAPLPDLIELCRRHDAVLLVDDSHGVGVMGADGRGTPSHQGVLGEIDVLTGTLGKALGGAAGGYVAASAEVVELLGQLARPSLFSNALPVPHRLRCSRGGSHPARRARACCATARAGDGAARWPARGGARPASG